MKSERIFGLLCIFIVFHSSYARKGCSEDTCQNGGNCQYIIGGFLLCHCKQYFFGKTCAIDSRKYMLDVEIGLGDNIHTLDEVSKLIIDAVNNYCIQSTSKCSMKEFNNDGNRPSIPFGYFWPHQVRFSNEHTNLQPGKNIKTKIFILGVQGENSNQIMKPETIKEALYSSTNKQWDLLSFDTKNNNTGSSLPVWAIALIAVCILLFSLCIGAAYKFRNKIRTSSTNIDSENNSFSDMESYQPTAPPLYTDKYYFKAPPPYIPRDRLNSLERAAQPPPYESIL